MNREEYINKIRDYLAILSYRIKLSNSISLTDINRHTEDFYCGFLNLLLGCQFKNLNTIKPNMPAIDLGDEVNKIAIQVTSTSSIKKTRETVEKFVEQGLHKNYDRLIILNIVKKAKHQKQYIGEEATYQFDTKKDIWDTEDLLSGIPGDDLLKEGIIYSLNVKKIKKLRDYLSENLDSESTSRVKYSNEVEVILELIAYLSSQSEIQGSVDEFQEAPDPEGKIHGRFADKAEPLKLRYTELHTIYGNLLDRIEEKVDISGLQWIKVGVYLKGTSDKILRECDGDPEQALDKLQENLEQAIQATRRDYDDGAIRYFLVDQLITCNVLPNKY